VVDESLKINMYYAESSEILRTSLKIKGAPVTLAGMKKLTL
jgi:hypothetical protein